MKVIGQFHEPTLKQESARRQTADDTFPAPWGINLTRREMGLLAGFGNLDVAPLFALLLEARAKQAVLAMAEPDTSPERWRREQGVLAVLDELKMILAEQIPELYRGIVANETSQQEQPDHGGISERPGRPLDSDEPGPG